MQEAREITPKIELETTLQLPNSDLGDRVAEWGKSITRTQYDKYLQRSPDFIINNQF